MRSCRAGRAAGPATVGQWLNWQSSGLQNRRLGVRVPPALRDCTAPRQHRTTSRADSRDRDDRPAASVSDTARGPPAASGGQRAHRRRRLFSARSSPSCARSCGRPAAADHLHLRRARVRRGHDRRSSSLLDFGFGRPCSRCSADRRALTALDRDAAAGRADTRIDSSEGSRRVPAVRRVRPHPEQSRRPRSTPTLDDERSRAEGETERADDDRTGQDQDIAQVEVDAGLDVAADAPARTAEVEACRLGHGRRRRRGRRRGRPRRRLAATDPADQPADAADADARRPGSRPTWRPPTTTAPRRRCRRRGRGRRRRRRRGRRRASSRCRRRGRRPTRCEEFRDRLRSQPGDWFVVHTYSGMENRVKANLESRIGSLNMEDYIYEIDGADRKTSPRSRTASASRSAARAARATSWSGWTSPTSRGSAVRHTPRSPASSATTTSRCR